MLVFIFNFCWIVNALMVVIYLLAAWGILIDFWNIKQFD